MPLGRVRVLEDRSLRLERVTLSDQGKYTCEADNPAGALTASATLTVNSPPSFTTRPLAQTVEAGQDVAFHCGAQGSPTPFSFWCVHISLHYQSYNISDFFVSVKSKIAG